MPIFLLIYTLYFINTKFNNGPPVANKQNIDGNPHA